MSDYPDYLSAKVHAAILETRRERDLHLDSWAALVKLDRDDFFGHLERDTIEPIRHGQPIAVGNRAFFLISWLMKNEHDEWVRAHFVYVMWPDGSVSDYPISRREMSTGFTCPSRAQSMLLSLAATASEHLADPESEVITLVPDTD